mmetsp:Transcript_24021/g.52045  ORF Transcript_24021/g.52045 Transcript_24021/m.52045 type:complete len:341 (-) Transcript_24021:1238-2260(-)
MARRKASELKVLAATATSTTPAGLSASTSAWGSTPAGGLLLVGVMHRESHVQILLLATLSCLVLQDKALHLVVFLPPLLLLLRARHRKRTVRGHGQRLDLLLIPAANQHLEDDLGRTSVLVLDTLRLLLLCLAHADEVGGDRHVHRPPPVVLSALYALLQQLAELALKLLVFGRALDGRLTNMHILLTLPRRHLFLLLALRLVLVLVVWELVHLLAHHLLVAMVVPHLPRHLLLIRLRFSVPVHAPALVALVLLVLPLVLRSPHSLPARVPHNQRRQPKLLHRVSLPLQDRLDLSVALRRGQPPHAGSQRLERVLDHELHAGGDERLGVDVPLEVQEVDI